MDVVRHATNLESLHLVLPSDAAQERPQPLAQLWRDQRSPFFGTEHAMEIGADVRHARIQPSLWDWCDIKIARHPTLKRWAIVGMSLRYKEGPGVPNASGVLIVTILSCTEPASR